MLQAATAIGGSVVAFSGEGARAAAAADAAQITWEAEDLCEAKYYSADWSTLYTATFPRAIEIPSADEPRTFVATWDQRLYQVEALAQLDSDASDGLSQILVRGSDTGSASITIPARTTTVLFRVTPVNLYPHENIAAARDAVFTVKSLSGDVLATASIAAERRDAAPWGAEVAVSWICSDGQVVPGVVNLKSVGPQPIPSGTVVVLDFADVQSDLSALVNDDPERRLVLEVAAPTRGTQRRTLSLNEQLSADDSVVIVNGINRSNSLPAEFQSMTPTVFVKEADGDNDARRTGMTSSLPITESGTPISTFEPAPTVLNSAAEKE